MTGNFRWRKGYGLFVQANGELLINGGESKVALREHAKVATQNTSSTVTVQVTRDLGKQMGA